MAPRDYARNLRIVGLDEAIALWSSPPREGQTERILQHHVGPFQAEPVGPYGYWIVADKFGLNVYGILWSQGIAEYYAGVLNESSR